MSLSNTPWSMSLSSLSPTKVYSKVRDTVYGKGPKADVGPPDALTSSSSQFNMNPKQPVGSYEYQPAMVTSHTGVSTSNISLYTPSPAGHGTVDEIASLHAEIDVLKRRLSAYQKFTGSSNGRGKNSISKQKNTLYGNKELIDCKVISEFVRERFFPYHKILHFEANWHLWNSPFSQDVMANTRITTPPEGMMMETYWATVLLPNFVKTFNENKNNLRTAMKTVFLGK